MDGPLVLDCSITMSWCFEDEADATSDQALDALRSIEAVVPAIWPFEVANVLLVAERNKRLTRAASARFVTLLDALPIEVQAPLGLGEIGEVLLVGRSHGLSSYDAAYLHLAMRTGAILATLDKALKRAARKCRIAVM